MKERPKEISMRRVAACALPGVRTLAFPRRGVELHEEELAANWEIAIRGGDVYRIAPLRK